MKTRTIKVYDNLGPHLDAEVGDMMILSDGSTYMWYSGSWNQVQIRGSERERLRREAGHNHPLDMTDDYDRAMSVI